MTGLSGGLSFVRGGLKSGYHGFCMDSYIAGETLGIPRYWGFVFPVVRTRALVAGLSEIAGIEYGYSV